MSWLTGPQAPPGSTVLTVEQRQAQDEPCGNSWRGPSHPGYKAPRASEMLDLEVGEPSEASVDGGQRALSAAKFFFFKLSQKSPMQRDLPGIKA